MAITPCIRLGSHSLEPHSTTGKDVILSNEEIEAKIFTFLREELRVNTDEVERDSELVSSGLVDSADLVRFATFLERSYGIVVEDQDINADNFNTIAMSADYVRAHLGG